MAIRDATAIIVQRPDTSTYTQYQIGNVWLTGVDIICDERMTGEKRDCVVVAL